MIEWVLPPAGKLDQRMEAAVARVEAMTLTLPVPMANVWRARQALGPARAVP